MRRHWRPLLKLTAFGALVAIGIYFVNQQYALRTTADDVKHQLDAGRIDLARAWKQYEDLRKSSMLGSLSGLRSSLKMRLMAAAAEPVADYRRDQPSAREGDWKRAAENLRRIMELDSKDQIAQGLLYLCEGHALRIRARTINGRKTAVDQKLLNQAVHQFEEAARLMPDSPDPYLGLARIYFYEEHDYDRGANMLTEASKRGHPLGKREKLQMADARRERGIRSVEQTRRFAETPDRERQYLVSAQADFHSAAEAYRELTYFVPAVPDLLADTQRRLRQVEARIQHLSVPTVGAQ